MKINKNKICAFIPARGGSKSIPLKNIVPLAGKPLITYVLDQIVESKDLFDSIICSTENKTISEYIATYPIDIDDRPLELAGDDASTASVIKDYLIRLHKNQKSIPDIVLVFQPTSPFVLKDHIKEIIKRMKEFPELNSAQTITKIEHNYHAYNQREFDGDLTNFHFRNLRKDAHNKQRKPIFYRFGNLLAVRAKAIINGSYCFPEPSSGVEIDRVYAVDIDGYDDILYGEYLINNKLI